MIFVVEFHARAHAKRIDMALYIIPEVDPPFLEVALCIMSRLDLKEKKQTPAIKKHSQHIRHQCESQYIQPRGNACINTHMIYLSCIQFAGNNTTRSAKNMCNIHNSRASWLIMTWKMDSNSSWLMLRRLAKSVKNSKTSLGVPETVAASSRYESIMCVVWAGWSRACWWRAGEQKDFLQIIFTTPYLSYPRPHFSFLFCLQIRHTNLPTTRKKSKIAFTGFVVPLWTNHRRVGRPRVVCCLNFINMTWPRFHNSCLHSSHRPLCGRNRPPMQLILLKTSPHV